MDPQQTRPQRSSLQFCKAFFEVNDAAATHQRLLGLGAQELSGAAAGSLVDRWYWWRGEATGDPGNSDAFVLRMRESRLVMEGPTAGAVGRGWRALNQQLRPHACARVAARDDLARFLPGRGRHAADRPETWSPEHEARVLAEFYASFAARWARLPHSRLDGLSPLQALRQPDRRGHVEELLVRMERVEEERRLRGMESFAVEDLRRALRDGAGGPE